MYNEVIFSGDSNVGKTSFLYQYTDGVFNPRFTSTVGVDFRQKRLIREVKNPDGVLGMRLRLHLQLWDTAGQERFRSLCTVFLRDAMGFLLVFDLTNEKSLMNCRDWMNLLCQHAYCDRPDVILVGNKADLSEERTVTLATATSMARQLGVPYIETSAATGHNVSKAIDMLLDAVMHRIEASVTKGKLHGALQVSNGNVLLHDGNNKRNKHYEEESTSSCSSCVGSSFMNNFQYLNTKKFIVEGTSSETDFKNIFSNDTSKKFVSSSSHYNFIIIRLDKPYQIHKVLFRAKNLRRNEYKQGFQVAISNHFRLCDKPWSYNRLIWIDKNVKFTRSTEDVEVNFLGHTTSNIIISTGSPYNFEETDGFVLGQVEINGCCQDENYSTSDLNEEDPIKYQIYPIISKSKRLKDALLNNTKSLFISKNVPGLVPLSSGQFCLISFRGKCSTIIGQYKDRIGGYLITTDINFWNHVFHPYFNRYRRLFHELVESLKWFFGRGDSPDYLITREDEFDLNKTLSNLLILAESSSIKFTKQARYLLYNEVPFFWLINTENSQDIDFTLNGFDIIQNDVILDEDNYFVLNKVTEEDIFAVEDVLRAVDYNTRSWIGIKPSVQTLKSEKARNMLNFFNFQAILEKYSEDFDKYLPCPERPLLAKDEGSGLISFLGPIRNLFLENNQSIEFPGALEYPGDVNPNTLPLNVTLEVNSTFPEEIIYLGVAVKPSKPWRFKVINGNSESWKFMIGCSPEIIRKREFFIRHVEVHRYVSMTKENQDIYHEFGGVLSLINLSPGVNHLTIEIQQVFHNAMLDVSLGEENSERLWNYTKNTTGASQAILKGENHIICTPLKLVYSYEYKKIVRSLNVLSEMVKLFHNFQGTSANQSRKEIVSMELQTSHGLAHSGYPWIANQDWMHNLLKVPANRADLLDGFCHELGHIFQHDKWFLPGTVEASNLFFCDLSYKLLYKNDRLGRQALKSLHYFEEKEKKHLLLFWSERVWPFTRTAGYAYFKILGVYFTEALLSNTITRMINETWPNDNDIVMKWHIILSQESGYDLTVFNRLFNLPINESSSQELLKDMPCWMPYEYPFSHIRRKTYMMAKAIGKSCYGGRKKINPKQDLLRGIKDLYRRVDVRFITSELSKFFFDF